MYRDPSVSKTACAAVLEDPISVLEMCLDMCVDVRADMCADMCVDMCEDNVRGHV